MTLNFVLYYLLLLGLQGLSFRHYNYKMISDKTNSKGLWSFPDFSFPHQEIFDNFAISSHNTSMCLRILILACMTEHYGCLLFPTAKSIYPICTQLKHTAGNVIWSPAHPSISCCGRKP